MVQLVLDVRLDCGPRRITEAAETEHHTKQQRMLFQVRADSKRAQIDESLRVIRTDNAHDRLHDPHANVSGREILGEQIVWRFQSLSDAEDESVAIFHHGLNKSWIGHATDEGFCICLPAVYWVWSGRHLRPHGRSPAKPAHKI